MRMVKRTLTRSFRVGSFVFLGALAAGCTDPNVTPDLAAAFTATPLSGEAPLTVQFTDQSSFVSASEISNRSWDFGDGGTSTQRNPEHTYTEAGDFTVSLTIGNGSSTARETKPEFISVQASGAGEGESDGEGEGEGEGTTEPPTADFTAEPTTGDAPLTVRFTGTAESGSSPVTAWAWDFGDGETSSDQSPEHTYTAEGIYSVSLSVTSADGTDVRMRQDLVVVTASNADATFLEGEQIVVVPGATLFANGQAFENGIAPASRGQLVGVYKNSRPYFYTPSLGDVALNETMSHTAMAVWMMEFVAGEGKKATAKAEEIRTGLEVTRNEAANTLTVSNKLNRWNAVKAPADINEIIFFTPKAPLPTSLASVITSQLPDEFDASTAREIAFDDRFLESYASIVHLMPILINDYLIPDVILDPTPQQQRAAELVRDFREAPDSTLMARVNGLGFLRLFVAMAGSLMETVPVSCIDLVVVPVLGSFETLFVGILTDGDEQALQQFIVNIQADLIENSTGCASMLVTLGASEVFFNGIDILGALAQRANQIVAVEQTLMYDAFARYPLDSDAPREIPEIGDPVPIVGDWLINIDDVSTQETSRDGVPATRTTTTIADGQLSFEPDGTWTYSLNATRTQVTETNGGNAETESRTAWTELGTGTYVVETVENCIGQLDDLCGRVRIPSGQLSCTLCTLDGCFDTDPQLSPIVGYRANIDPRSDIDGETISNFPTCFLGTFSLLRPR